MTARPSFDDIGILTAILWSHRSTCPRRRVGCYMADRTHRVVSHGYNGAASGQPHCINSPCPGAHLPSGTGLELCQAIHAETNALLYYRDPERLHTCYCTASPCISCAKLLLGTACQRVVFLEEYPHPQAGNLWRSTGREWLKHEPYGVWTLDGIMSECVENQDIGDAH